MIEKCLIFFYLYMYNYSGGPTASRGCVLIPSHFFKIHQIYK